MTRRMQEVVFELAVTLLAVSALLGVALLAGGCKTLTTAAPVGGNAALAQINGQNVDGAAKALTAASTATTEARESNAKAVRAFAAVCASPDLPPQSKPAAETGVAAAQETGKQLEATQAALADVKSKGTAAVAGWKANEADYQRQIAERDSRLDAAAKQHEQDAASIANLKADNSARNRWVWLSLIGVCALGAGAALAFSAYIRSKLWACVSGGFATAGALVACYRRIDGLPDWYWMTLVGVLVLGGGGLAAYEFVLNRNTSATGSDIPTAGETLLDKLKSAIA